MNSELLLSRFCIFVGIVAIAGPLCATAFYPQFPIWLAVLAGAAVGCPLLVIGFRLDPTADPQAASRFWPAQTETWEMVGLLAYAGTFLAPAMLFLPMFWLVPAGDDWPIVAVRILLIATAIGASYWWLGFAKNKLSGFFRGKLPDARLDAFVNAERRKEPDSARSAARQNWELLFVAAMAFLVAYWFLNFNNPGAVLNNGPRRLRAAIWLLQWCRGNPNTVVSSSVLVGVWTLGLYVYRVARASILCAASDGSR